MPHSARIERPLSIRARSLFYFPSSLGPVLFFGQVAGLGQTARVQRGPSEAARCASNGTALLPALPLLTPATSPPSTPSPKTSTHTAS
jgi:hypothetical protein